MHRIALATAITLVGLTGCDDTAKYTHVDFPSKPGNYLQVYEQDGKQWLELAKVRENGESQRVRGEIETPIDMASALPRTKVIFEHCGHGYFVQPQLAVTKVYFEGFSADDGCEIQNAPVEYLRISAG